MLAAENNAPRAELDRANNELRRTAAEKTIAEIAIAKARTSINVHQAALDVAMADKATAEWKLSKTDVNAPADGWINNLTVRIGDTATVSLPNVGIVDAHAWRIIANYKEYYIRPFEIGGTAWVWLDSSPWQFRKARITGIARGFSRDPAGAHAAALRRADHRLDPPAAAHPGDYRARRAAARRQALHGGGRAHRRVPAMRGRSAISGTSPARSTTSRSRLDITSDTLVSFGRELAELGEAPDRTRQGLVAACSVVLATFLALLLEIQSPWWAAISAFMSLIATGGGSLRRGLLRLTGTAAGALLGFVMARWLPYDHFALYLFIAGITMLGVVAMQVSPHGLAWLFLTITSILVLLEA